MVDIANGEVHEVQSLPSPHPFFGCCIFKNRPYVIKNNIYMYKREDNSWVRMGRLRSSFDVGVAVADSQFIYIASKMNYTVHK